MKKSAIILASVFVLCFCGCVNPLLYGRHPTEQPGTIWATKDNRASFSIPLNDDEPILGTIKAENADIEVQFHMGIFNSVFEVTYGVYGEGELIVADEIWNAQTMTKNKFIVEIRESNYFEEGEELVFYKTK